MTQHRKKEERSSPKSLISKRRRSDSPYVKRTPTAEEVAELFSLTPDAVRMFASDTSRPFDENGGLTGEAIDAIRSRHQALWSMEQVRDALSVPNAGVWCLADVGLLGTVYRGS